MEVLKVKICRPGGKIPQRASEGAVGFDLYAGTAAVIEPRSHDLVPCGVAVELPFGTYGRIAERSGLSLKKGISLGAGVVDPDYRGEIGAVLFNHTDSPFEVKEGDRIAQLICERVSIPAVLIAQKLSETKRGNNGFGSTGV